MLGLSKSFIITFILAIIIGYGTHNIQNFFVIMVMYVIIRIIWNILT
jgi:hypothetical protein